MAIKVKELKDDALVDIKVNKSYYLMAKAALFYLFQHIKDDDEREKHLKQVMEGKYEDMNDWERAFYTLTILLADIENNAKKANLYEEKEILEPEDEGYVPPTQE
jgi:hypothetical protein